MSFELQIAIMPSSLIHCPSIVCARNLTFDQKQHAEVSRERRLIIDNMAWYEVVLSACLDGWESRIRSSRVAVTVGIRADKWSRQTLWANRAEHTLFISISRATSSSGQVHWNHLKGSYASCDACQLKEINNNNSGRVSSTLDMLEAALCCTLCWLSYAKEKAFRLTILACHATDYSRPDILCFH